MRSIIVAQVILAVIGAFGAPNERDQPKVVRLPIKYKIVDIRFSQDTTETGTQTDTSRWDTGQKYHTTKTDTEKTTKSMGVGIGATMQAEASASSSGKPEAMVKGGVKVNADAELRNSSSHDTRTESGSSEGTTKNRLSAQTFTKDDWQLRLHVEFKNTSTNQTLVYDPEDRWGLFADVHYKGRHHRIDLPLQKSELGILAPGKVIIPEIKTYVKEWQRKADLRELQDANMLKESFILGNDSRFNFVDKETTNKWSVSDRDYSVVVNVDFEGRNADQFPIFIQVETATTYKQILDVASGELPTDYKFEFTTDGVLEKVLGRDFGRFDTDKKGIIYSILANVDGEIKGSISGWEKLSLDHNKNRLCFTRVGVNEILNGCWSGVIQNSVISNCLFYIDESLASSRKISTNDLYMGALLAEKVGHYGQFVHFFSAMSDEDRKRYMEDNGQYSTVCSMIQGDNDKYFAKVYNPEWELGFAAKYKRTILGFAAEKGALNIVKWLIGGCPQKYQKEVDELVPDGKKDSPGDAGKTSLFWAAKGGHLEVCQYLVSKGADVNRKFYDYKGASKKIKKLDELVDEQEITDAKVRKYIEAERKVYYVRNKWINWHSYATARDIRQWIGAGVSPNAYLGGKWNLLSCAIDLNDTDLIYILIKNGADVNAEYSVCPTDRRTALMLACEKGHTSLMTELILKGADLYSQQEDDMTAFHYAIKCKKYDCAQMLLDNGLDVKMCPSVKVDGEWIDPQKFAEEFRTINSLCAKARQGDDDAQNELGKLYVMGIGVVKDEREAFNLFQKAADNGHAAAHANLSKCYSNGRGVAKDTKKAEFHRKKAEELGYYLKTKE